MTSAEQEEFAAKQRITLKKSVITRAFEAENSTQEQYDAASNDGWERQPDFPYGWPNLEEGPGLTRNTSISGAGDQVAATRIRRNDHKRAHRAGVLTESQATTS